MLLVIRLACRNEAVTEQRCITMVRQGVEYSNRNVMNYNVFVKSDHNFKLVA